MISKLIHPYHVSEIESRTFQSDGFIILRGIISPTVLDALRREVDSCVIAVNPLANKPMDERSTYERAFTQVVNLWRMSEEISSFVHSKQLAKIAADLMGSTGIRLYHDQALYKEAGGGMTPWHADQYYWPLGTHNTCTAWIPLQDTPLEMGPLSFARRSHTFSDGRNLAISDRSEKELDHALEGNQYEHSVSPFSEGDISFHLGWTYHRADPNHTTRTRRAFTIIYVEDGTRVVASLRPEHDADRDAFIPGRAPGQKVDTEMNPVLYP